MNKLVIAVLICCIFVVVSSVYIDPFGNRHHKTHDGRRNTRRRNHRLESTPDGEEETRQPKRHRHKWHRWLPDWMTKRSKNSFGPWKVDFDLDKIFNWQNVKPWWKGPNVCERVEVPVDKASKDTQGKPISHHLVFRSTMCDDTGSVYKCTIIEINNGRSTTYVKIKECCHGYRREKGKIGCSEELELNSTINTMRSLGGTEFLKALKSMDMVDTVNQDNFTIFLPTNEAFKVFQKPFEPDETHMVEITPDLVETALEMQDVLAGHMVEGWLPTRNMEDEHVFQTTYPDSSIRVNFYSSPKKMMTANCAKVTSSDNMATNGVIHVVDRVILPADESLLSLVSKDPQLSTLKTILTRSGMSRILKENEGLTLFAPTNTAFEKLDPKFRHGILNGHTCLNDIIKNHILPNVICSEILEGKVWTYNLMKQKVSLRKDKQGKLFFGEGQIIKTDIMASNGVLHVTDSVSIPRSAKPMSEVLRKAGAKKFIDLVEKAKLTSFLNDLENITLFVPTDKAIGEVPQETLKKLQNNLPDLRDVIKYHIVSGEYKHSELEHKAELESLAGKGDLTIRHKGLSFSLHPMKTVQCATILERDVTSCNGVAHFIDKLLLPPSGDLISLLSAHPNYSTLLELFKKAGLADEIQNGHYTILAPSNQAFQAIEAGKLDQLKKDVEKLKDFLKHYLISGAPMCCASLTNGLPTFVKTLSGQHVTVAKSKSWFLGNAAAITQCDRMASNGIIHGIDKVLPEAVRKYFKEKPKFEDGVIFPEDTDWIDRIHKTIRSEDVPGFEWSEEFFPDGGDFFGL